MNADKNPVILVFAIIGVCAVLYGVWHSTRDRSLRIRRANFFPRQRLPVLPDLFTRRAAPPPQP